MANIEFNTTDSGVVLDVVYGDDVAYFTVHFPQGEVNFSLRVGSVKDLHESLEAWMKLRKERMAKERKEGKKPFTI